MSSPGLAISLLRGNKELRVSIDLDENSKVKWPLPNSQKDALIEIFCLLHPLMEESFCFNDMPLPHLSPAELFDYAVTDNRLITGSLYALATGRKCWDKDDVMTNRLWASKMMGCFVASEVMGRLI